MTKTNELYPIAMCSNDIRDTKSGYMIGGIVGYAKTETQALNILKKKYKNTLELKCKFDVIVCKVLSTDVPNVSGIDFFRYGICHK